jgi:phage protein U
MYAQLGTTVFDALKSFVTFSQDEEAVLVEHALISRKPRLQGSGIGLQTLTLSLFLHQEFCNVEEETAALRESKNTFEILSLLWGNGKLEGDFVIKQLTIEKVQQDNQGNTYASTVNVVLLESVKDNRIDQAQQDATKKAFATGSKNPAAKSSRINTSTCEKSISDAVSSIRSNGASVNTYLQGFYYQPIKQNGIQISCEDIISKCASIIVATNSQGSCVYDNDNLRSSANNVRASADSIKGDVYNRSVDMNTLKSENIILQSAINALCKVAASITHKAIIP